MSETNGKPSMFTDGKGNRLSEEAAAELLGSGLGQPQVIERPTCATCIHFENDGDANICTRNPPVIDPSRSDYAGVYPEVEEHQGCAEHHLFPAYLARLPKAQGDESIGDAFGEDASDAQEAFVSTPNNDSYRWMTDDDKTFTCVRTGKVFTLAEAVQDVVDRAAAHDAELNGAVNRLAAYAGIKPDTPTDAERVATLSATVKNLWGIIAQRDKAMGDRNVTIDEQAEIIAMKDETIKLKNETITKLREDKSLRDEMGWEQAEVIAKQVKGMEGLRRVIAEKDRKAKEWEDAYNRVNKEATRLHQAIGEWKAEYDSLATESVSLRNERDAFRTEANNLRGEVTQIGELNDRQERKLDEANENIERLTREVETGHDVIMRKDERFSQATERYRELSEAAQQVSRRRRTTGAFCDVPAVLMDDLKAVLNRHARPADFNTNSTPTRDTPNKSRSGTSLSVTLDTTGLEQRTREMAEKMVRERVEPIRQAALEVLRESAINPIRSEYWREWSAVPDVVLGKLERRVMGEPEPEPIATL